MESNLNHYKKWLSFLSEVELFFTNKGFLKVKTPCLVPSGAMEACLDAFEVGKSHFLPTSPEFSLKKLWLSGFADRLFEVSPSFRAYETGPLHLEEFNMLEFYSAFETFEDLKILSVDFVSEVLDLNPQQFKLVKLNEAFKSFTGFEINPDSDKDFLKRVLRFHGLNYRLEDSWNDLYQVIYINLIEPQLCKESLVGIENYPPQLSALSKINSLGWAGRFELYFKGVEIGNGYDELMDPVEAKKRWLSENKERKKLGKKPHPIDQKLLSITEKTSVSHGVGMAMGLERLFKIKFGSSNISVWPFK